MNSLVLRILIISLVFSMGYGLDFPAREDSHTQKTEVNSILSNTEAFSSNKLTESNINNWLRDQDPVDNVFEVDLSATEWDWQIRKTGVFCSEVMVCKVNTNRDLLVDFNGFANLINSSSNTQINTSYAISQLIPPPPNSAYWIPANDLNLADFIIPAHNEMTWNLWCLVDVTSNITAAEYENRPTITFSVSGVIYWVEPELSYDRRLNFSKIKQNDKR